MCQSPILELSFRKTTKFCILLVLDRNIGNVLKIMIIDIFEGVRLHFYHIFNFFKQKNRNSHVLVFNYWTFLKNTSKLSSLFVLDFNFGIQQKNTIIDIFEGVRLHFFHFMNLFQQKNRNSHMLVFNFGVFFEGNGQIKYFVLIRNKFWHWLEKYYN